jgi:hypothetical protein
MSAYVNPSAMVGSNYLMDAEGKNDGDEEILIMIMGEGRNTMCRVPCAFPPESVTKITLSPPTWMVHGWLESERWSHNRKLLYTDGVDSQLSEVELAELYPNDVYRILWENPFIFRTLLVEYDPDHPRHVLFLMDNMDGYEVPELFKHDAIDHYLSAESVEGECRTELNFLDTGLDVTIVEGDENSTWARLAILGEALEDADTNVTLKEHLDLPLDGMVTVEVHE